MSKNRPRNSHSLKALPILKVVVVCLVLGTFAIVYLHQKNRQMSLGHEIRKLEADVENIRKENRALQSQILQLKQPRQLAYKCQQWQRGLVKPTEEQFVRIYEAHTPRNAQYAADQRRGGRVLP